MTAPAIVLAGTHLALAAWALRRLPFLHPVALWSVPLAGASSLFALHLLPYRPISVATVVLLCAATAAFCAGVALSPRLDRRRDRTPLPAALNYQAVELAARICLIALGALLALFLLLLVASYGPRDALAISPVVRADLAEGTASLTIKYVYFTLSAGALCALAAAMAPTRPARRRWLIAAGAAALSGYFSTGRSNILLPLVVAAVVYGVARDLRPSLRAQAAATGAAIAFVLAIFLVGGSIIGKTIDANPLARVPSPFTEHRTLAPFGLPYEYATAPIAGLEVQRAVAARQGRSYGCATFSSACQLLRSAGLPVEPVPRIRPFTREPIPWNTFTALDLPLLDGGPAAVLLFFLAFGALAGVLWRRARERRTVALLTYGVLAVTLVFAPIQNNMFAPHIVGAILITIGVLAFAVLLLGFERRVESAGALPAAPAVDLG